MSEQISSLSNLRTQLRTHPVVRTGLLAFAGSMFIAVCAHITVPLPFTPVPMTLENFGVLLVGLLLGPIGGLTAGAMYLMEGALGLPVFQPYGVAGIARLAGPTGGYLMAYPYAAALAGWIFSRSRSIVGAVAGSVVADAAILAGGAVWFAALTHMSSGVVLSATIVPFLASEAVKTIAAAGLARTIRSARRAS
ncbi:MAG: biotin transporter BioY [Acidobacteria bacterium]|nr:biotin transporter BioY [Acidobacteriota bacterium]